jgi:hypothetical protein
MSTRVRDAHRLARREAVLLRQNRQRRRRLAFAATAVGSVLLVVIVLVIVKVSGVAESGSRPTTGMPVPAAVTAVPPAVLDAVGLGKVGSLPRPTSGQQTLTSNGKPLVVYIGAEYCPYCAAQRWALVVALSRFGVFTGLTVTHSATDDIYPDTITMSFHGAVYASQYLEFQGVETHTNIRSGNGYTTLDKLTDQQDQVMRIHNASGSIPFLDFGNRYVLSGASFSPQLLAGKSVDEISAALSDPHSEIAQAVNGAANAFTAAICQLTGGQPRQVCGGPAATAYQGKLA